MTDWEPPATFPDVPIGANCPDGPFWIEAAAAHPAWGLVPDLTPLREGVLAVVDIWAGRFAAARARLADDPWWDDELACRASRHGGQLLTEVSAAVAGARPDAWREDLLTLLVFPFAHQAYWATAVSAAAEPAGDAAVAARMVALGLDLPAQVSVTSPVRNASTTS